MFIKSSFKTKPEIELTVEGHVGDVFGLVPEQVVSGRHPLLRFTVGSGRFFRIVFGLVVDQVLTSRSHRDSKSNLFRDFFSKKKKRCFRARQISTQVSKGIKQFGSFGRKKKDPPRDSSSNDFFFPLLTLNVLGSTRNESRNLVTSTRTGTRPSVTSQGRPSTALEPDWPRRRPLEREGERPRPRVVEVPPTFHCWHQLTEMESNEYRRKERNGF